jgi:hypothetical protein
VSVRSRRGSFAAVLAAAAVVLPLGGPGQASAAAAPEVVDVSPAASTPQVLGVGSAGAAVQAITRVGSSVVVGGTFTQVADPGSAVAQAAQNLMVYDAATGHVTARPLVNGPVSVVLPGSTAGTVYVGGKFTKVGTSTVSNLALLRVSDGAVVASFKAPTFNDVVTDLELVGNHLLVGGKFTKVGSVKQTALVSLSATKGTADAWVSLAFAGHHNWTGKSTLDAKAAVGITEMARNPAGTRLVVIGNFTTVAKLPRDQVAVIELTGTPKVSTSWATTALAARCNGRKWDSWVRDVAVSPDGSYFVVASMGGPHAGTPCDGAVRFELSTRSTDVPATWVASTGGDSVLAVAIDTNVVYVGGHMRWMNNFQGSNTPGPGAVPRPCLAALDPATGLPLAWNPGENPRNVGVQAMLLTSDGLLVGGDNPSVGDRAIARPGLAFFPLASGTALPDTTQPALPDVYRAGAPDLAAGAVERLHLAAGGVDHRWVEPVTSSIDWSTVRGAFTVAGGLWTAQADGTLWRQSFDGESVGSAVAVAPWDDPAWRDVQTGSGETYLGKPSSLVGDLAQVQALTYSGGRLYYALAGSTALHVRFFDVGSGVVADRSSIVRGVVVPTTTTGLFVQGTSMYVADASGTLTRRTLMGQSIASTGAVVSGPAVDGVDWSRAVLFSGPGPEVPTT